MIFGIDQEICSFSGQSPVFNRGFFILDNTKNRINTDNKMKSKQ